MVVVVFLVVIVIVVVVVVVVVVVIVVVVVVVLSPGHTTCNNGPPMELASCQMAAIQHINARARGRRSIALETREHIRQMCNLPSQAMESAVETIRSHARVALHFHPDRPVASGQTVAEALLEHGTYRNQFETKISNGGVTAFAGGQRDECERRLFGGSYHTPEVTPEDRPRYGALDLLGHAEGPAPRFGSCYFILAGPASQRCTITYQDSHSDPSEVGTLEELDDVLAALLRDVFFHDAALGERDLTVATLLRRIESALANPVGGRAAHERPFRNLNQYIEAQVHGPVLLATDADALVVDPSFRGTATEDRLSELCRRYEVALQWHHGFRLPIEDVPSNFRGPSMPSLAKRIATEGIVDVRAIGTAVRDLVTRPDAWSHRGAVPEVLQELKLLWHVLVRYGAPVSTGAPA